MNYIKLYQVESIKNLDLTMYKNGDMFLYNNQLYALLLNKVAPIQQDLSKYVKKSELEKLIKKMGGE